MAESKNHGARRVDRAVEWRSRLAFATAGVLAFLTLTGLFIWLLRFGVFTQVSVLVHTAIGLLFFVPATWYCVRHWLVYRRHPFAHIKLLGYLGVFVLLACAISGLVLTWQPLFGIRISYFWRGVHQWTTVALIAFAIPHILLIVQRDARAAMTEALASVSAAKKRFGWGTLGWVVVGFALVVLGCYAYMPPRLITKFPPDYDLWQPRNPLYGKNLPFAPSLARTKDNKPIDARLLAGSEDCGTAGCHEQIVNEWHPSAHRYSALDKAFQAIQLTMAKQNGPTSTRYCGGCHDPISLFSGTKNIFTDEAQLTALHGYREGISCLSCHSIRQTDIRGNAQFVVHAPPRYIGELEYDAATLEYEKTKKDSWEKGAWHLARDFLIRAYPREHVASLSKVMFKKPEYCAACHKQFVDEEVNKVGWVQLQNQFDNWKASKWAHHREDPRRTTECRECHMPLVPSHDPAAGDAYDYNRSPNDGKHRSHRFVAANQLMPGLLELPGADEQVRLTEQWLKGEFPIPEIEDKWRKAGVPAVSIQLIAPPTAQPSQPVHLRCVITSNKVGHDFPTGPLDIIQAWVEVVVKDEQGKVVYKTGTVDKEGFIKPGSFIFKAEPVDQSGNLIDRHNLWEMVGVRNRRALFPGFSDTAEFSFLCPELRTDQRKILPAEKHYTFKAPSTGKLLVTAKLCYRKIDQFLLNFLRSVGFFSEFKGKHLTSPITDMHEQQAVIEVGSGRLVSAPAPSKGVREPGRRASRGVSGG
ncbi:MAG: hypothetical protein HY320_05235 [Armatimonadetes bacterium]|nr:hypothetical protein [Armatimonadota bacterium]